jgi:hypothetical protein
VNRDEGGSAKKKLNGLAEARTCGNRPAGQSNFSLPCISGLPALIQCLQPDADFTHRDIDRLQQFTDGEAGAGGAL